jgi:hypothetical protein
MDPTQAWTLIAFLSLMTAALLMLDVGMRRRTSAGGALTRRRSGSDDVAQRGDHVTG